ncbi:MAG: LysR family transcriptional regulator [Burkholderiales bacterium]|jgi:DNA-binding transcriptional LysR family regulator|nr:LysR family transcriptional regulator [Burkholderiales bacterium]MCA3163151.1 LysR family transcriptional regulator [Burkholderiales bacterium]MCA3166374.1 LysR family transcriptional regulator [Burkholderiales bacterium]MCA3169346.1 LysR family transcriptional regulator [Burkholderiales bacterium]MCA3173232.1 LysR family transcriptional regulator [Burkholderiales bacterium]
MKEADISLAALQAVVEVARHGNFARAADALGVSAPAISKQVSLVEARTGVRLFNRTTRQVRATEEGASYAAQAAEALALLQNGLERLTARRREPEGLVRLSTGAAVGRRYVLPLLKGLQERYPKVSLEINFDDRLVDLVSEGYDIGIRGSELEDGHFVARKLFDLVAVIAAAPVYFQCHGVPLTPADLAHHECIGLRFLNGKTLGWEFKRGREQVVHVPRARLTVSDPEAACELAMQGLGLALVGLHHAWPHLRSGRLQCALLGWQQPIRTLYLHYPHRQHLPPRVRVVVEHLLQGMTQNPDLIQNNKSLNTYLAPFSARAG